MAIVKTGLEVLPETVPTEWKGRRLGLLCNPASVSSIFVHARDICRQAFPGQLSAMFSPQHGFFAEKQDNMIESDHLVDPRTGIPVFSLYGETRIPTREMFDGIDILLIDLQDAGTRVYTFIYTMSYCMEVARKLQKKVVVLDRPNPVGGSVVEGNVLETDYCSFVGRYPIPMRHGLTIGELARLFNDHFQIHCDLEVIPMTGWKREMNFPDTGLPWVPPSPNLPTPTAAMVYPGQVIWEGTNVSEGRGTAQPFELFGAPFLDLEKIGNTIPGDAMAGVILRPATFEPTANKWAGTPCRGFQIHVTDPDAYRPYRLTLELLRAVFIHHKNEFQWKQPPYEYEFTKMPIDLICGHAATRKAIENNADIVRLEQSWEDKILEFKKISKKYHLYD